MAMATKWAQTKQTGEGECLLVTSLGLSDVRTCVLDLVIPTQLQNPCFCRPFPTHTGQIVGALSIGACLTQAPSHEIPSTRPCVPYGLMKAGLHDFRFLHGLLQEG